MIRDFTSLITQYKVWFGQTKKRHAYVLVPQYIHTDLNYWDDTIKQSVNYCKEGSMPGSSSLQDTARVWMLDRKHVSVCLYAWMTDACCIKCSE